MANSLDFSGFSFFIYLDFSPFSLADPLSPLLIHPHLANFWNCNVLGLNPWIASFSMSSCSFGDLSQSHDFNCHLNTNKLTNLHPWILPSTSDPFYPTSYLMYLFCFINEIQNSEGPKLSSWVPFVQNFSCSCFHLSENNSIILGQNSYFS